MRPLRIEELDQEVTPEPMLRLTSARVIFAFYKQIQQDFPALGTDALMEGVPALGRASRARRAQMTKRLIDEWLIANAALISASQAGRQNITRHIVAEGPSVTAYRPPRYGRAIIVNPEVPAWLRRPRSNGSEAGLGLLDVKGVGVAPGITPTLSAHGTGLFPLGDIFHELMNQMLLDMIFRYVGVRFSTLPVYAVLDASFDCRDWRTPEAPFRPVGIMIRQAHRRAPGGPDMPGRHTVAQLVCAEIEMLLRHFGVTSSNPSSQMELVRLPDGRVELRSHDGVPHTEPQGQLKTLHDIYALGERTQFDGINVQMAREVFDAPSRAVLIDFGQYRVCPRFENPVLSTVRDRPFRWGGILTPDDERFIQPDPRLAVRVECWEEKVLDDETARHFEYPLGSRLTRPQEVSMNLAMRWRAGEITGEVLLGELRAHVARSIAHWPDEEGSCPPGALPD